MKRFFFLLALAMALGGCVRPGVWTPDAKSVVDGLWDAAKMLCLLANAEKTGTTMDKVQDCCEKREQIEPWLEAARFGVRAGAVRAGMSEPLTPSNAEPNGIKPVPELENQE